MWKKGKLWKLVSPCTFKLDIEFIPIPVNLSPQLISSPAIKKQNKIFVKAAKYLRRRRRRREKKLKLPNNALLKDYTDDGGGEIDSDLQYAVYESLQLRGTDPNKFNASLGELFWKYERR